MTDIIRSNARNAEGTSPSVSLAPVKLIPMLNVLTALAPTTLVKSQQTLAAVINQTRGYPGCGIKDPKQWMFDQELGYIFKDNSEIEEE